MIRLSCRHHVVIDHQNVMSNCTRLPVWPLAVCVNVDTVLPDRSGYEPSYALPEPVPPSHTDWLDAFVRSGASSPFGNIPPLVTNVRRPAGGICFSPVSSACSRGNIRWFGQTPGYIFENKLARLKFTLVLSPSGLFF